MIIDWRTITYSASGSVLAWIWDTFIDFRSTVSSSVPRITCTVIPLPCIMILERRLITWSSHDYHMCLYYTFIPHSVHTHCRGRRHRHPIAFHSGCRWSQLCSRSWMYLLHWCMCLHFGRDWSDTGSDPPHSHCPEDMNDNAQIIITHHKKIQALK